MELTTEVTLVVLHLRCVLPRVCPVLEACCFYTITSMCQCRQSTRCYPSPPQNAQRHLQLLQCLSLNCSEHHGWHSEATQTTSRLSTAGAAGSGDAARGGGGGGGGGVAARGAAVAAAMVSESTRGWAKQSSKRRRHAWAWERWESEGGERRADGASGGGGGGGPPWPGRR